MAYAVTKRIKGHDYRYMVEGYRDPQTQQRKTRWQYIGAVEGADVRPGRTLRKRVSRDEIIAATARLLDSRGPEHITVDVIVGSVGASRSTFYRYFSDEQSVLSAALARITDESLRELPSLAAQPQSSEEARDVLHDWVEAYYGRLSDQRAVRSVLTQSGKGRARIECSLVTEEPGAHLTAYLQMLNDAGYAALDDPSGVARAITGIGGAMQLAQILTPAKHEISLAQFEDVYPLIERAVFGTR